METDKCSDLNHDIRTVAELEEDFRKLSKPYLLAFVVVLLVCATGLIMTPFIHGASEQATATTILICAFMISGMIITVKLPMPSQFSFVGTKEMVSIGEKVERYPELREKFCRILSVRPVLTKAEYARFASAIAELTANEELAADKLATEEAWAAVQKRLRCGDSMA